MNREKSWRVVETWGWLPTRLGVARNLQVGGIFEVKSPSAHHLFRSSFLLLLVLLTACSTPTDPNPPPPGVDTGSLQISVIGLPVDVDAAVEVTGPEAYQQTLKRSQTLQVPTGTYTVSIASVTTAGITYAGKLDVKNVDVARDQIAAVTATYTTVGQVGPNEIAPGVTRTGKVAPDSFKDYSFKGTTNVPLAFDLKDSVRSTNGRYRVEIYRTEDTTEPLYAQGFSAYFARPPVVGFAPQTDGDYFLRVRGVAEVFDYSVTAAYLSGSPAERATPEVLAFGDKGEGGVTKDSFDSYRFSGTFNMPVVFKFSYDKGDSNQFKGSFLVEVYTAGSAEPLSTKSYSTFRLAPEVTFTPQVDGDYELRLVGLDGIVKYSFSLERLE